MRRSPRDPPAPLAALLDELAAQAGHDRLHAASVTAALGAVLGPYLARRVVDLRLDGQGCRLMMRDAASAREVQRHAAELLDGLRRRLGPRAPSRLEAVVTREDRAAAIGAATEKPPGRQRMPLAEAALEAIEDPRTREQLARLARIELMDGTLKGVDPTGTIPR